MGLLRPLVVAVFCLAAAVDALAQAAVPKPPEIAARAYLLEDFASGAVLVEHNADERLEPASLTKMMTAYVAFAELEAGNLALDDQAVVSEKAWRTPGSRTFIEVGTRVTVEDLLLGIIVQSGNDASVALAEHIAGDERTFAGLMNQYARRLGLENTHFVNSTGLPDPEHYTTARDLTALARALIRDFPERYKWHAIRTFTYNDIEQPNRNRLLWRDESVDGIKTGYTSSAGYCLVTSAERDGMRLISVILGSGSERERTQQAQALLNYGFRFFETHRLYAAREPVTRVRVWKGDRGELPVGPEHDLYVTVARGQYDRLNARIEVDSKVFAPVSEGERRGKVVVTLGDRTLAEVPLVALETVAEGTLWQRLADNVRLLFE